MGARTRWFADDGWAIWIDGDDRSTVYMNEWVNPYGKNYVDIGIRIHGVKKANELNIYIPFQICIHEIKDLSAMLSDEDILRGIFNSNCIIDTKKNEYTSELRYDNRIVSLINLSKDKLITQNINQGTVVKVEIGKIQEYITSDEAYILFRIPHKSLDNIFSHKIDVSNVVGKLKELISSPIITQKYGYSIRINEARLLPSEINKINELHNQNLRKVLVTISLDESYELNDSNCYRIRRLEEELYKNYAPSGYDCSDAITYQWVEERDKNMKAHYNFYFDIVHNAISKKSMFLYLLIILLTAVMGSALYDLFKNLIELI